MKLRFRLDPWLPDPYLEEGVSEMRSRCENLVDESFNEMRRALEEARQLSLSCQSYQAAKKLMKAAAFSGEAMAATRLCDVPGGFERSTVYQALAGDVLRNLKRCMGGGAALSGLRRRR